MSDPLAQREPFEVLVIGAGQAGLALGHHLSRRGAHFVILEAGAEVGHSWRRRWDSLRLFSPAQYDSLPGLPFPAPADTHPSKDEVADYLASYAAHFALPVRLSTPVLSVHREESGDFVVTTPSETLRAEQVVVATGPFQSPHVPALAEHVDPRVPQLHTAGYRNPGQLPPVGDVLVVGAANSGLQVAAELATALGTGSSVTVAVGSKPTELPQRIAGRDLFHWLDRCRFFTMPAESRIARRLRARGDIVIGTRSATLRRNGVRFRPRLTGVSGRTARFADGSTMSCDAIVWATGYRSDYSWLQVPGVIVDGQVRHQAGSTAVPGLHFLGLPWQTCRGSALLGFVGRDAAALAERIAPEPAQDAHRRPTSQVRRSADPARRAQPAQVAGTSS